MRVSYEVSLEDCSVKKLHNDASKFISSHYAFKKAQLCF